MRDNLRPRVQDIRQIPVNTLDMVSKDNTPDTVSKANTPDYGQQGQYPRPPNYIPRRPYGHNDLDSLRHCLYRLGYMWLYNGNNFWVDSQVLTGEEYGGIGGMDACGSILK